MKAQAVHPAMRWAEVTGLPLSEWADLSEGDRRLISVSVSEGTYGVPRERLYPGGSYAWVGRNQN